MRREFFEIAPLAEAERVRGSSVSVANNVPSTRRLLVFGGSQGARVFNAVMPRIATRLLEYVPGLMILHQTGKGTGGVDRGGVSA